MKSIEKIQSILKRECIDAWMLVQDEQRDPYFDKLIAKNVTILTVAIITQGDFIVIGHSLEKELIEHYVDPHKLAIYSRTGDHTLSNLIIDYLNENQHVKSIALNYTTMNDIQTDIIGYGYYQNFASIINRCTANLEIVSAERIIYALTDGKEPEDLKKMEIAAKRASDILMAAFPLIKCGMSEIDLIELVHSITEKSRLEFLEAHNGYVVAEEYSWEAEACPIALTGKSFLKGGHALSSNTPVEKGNTVYFDFGVKLTFADESKWSSDLQRTAYFLKDEESEPPVIIKERFQAIIDAISLGMTSIKVGMRGYQIDEVVRNFLTSKGYPSYDHATGHAIGENAHNPGANFTMTPTGSGLLQIQPNGVYTIEPRIPLENGVSIEEMIVVREDGSVGTLCDRQQEIILIR